MIDMFDGQYARQYSTRQHGQPYDAMARGSGPAQAGQRSATCEADYRFRLRPKGFARRYRPTAGQRRGERCYDRIYHRSVAITRCRRMRVGQM
jgi:hypothetical protein